MLAQPPLHQILQLFVNVVFFNRTFHTILKRVSLSLLQDNDLHLSNPPCSAENSASRMDALSTASVEAVTPVKKHSLLPISQASVPPMTSSGGFAEQASMHPHLASPKPKYSRKRQFWDTILDRVEEPTEQERNEPTVGELNASVTKVDCVVQSEVKTKVSGKAKTIRPSEISSQQSDDAQPTTKRSRVQDTSILADARMLCELYRSGMWKDERPASQNDQRTHPVPSLHFRMNLAPLKPLIQAPITQMPLSLTRENTWKSNFPPLIENVKGSKEAGFINCITSPCSPNSDSQRALRTPCRQKDPILPERFQKETPSPSPVASEEQAEITLITAPNEEGVREGLMRSTRRRTRSTKSIPCPECSQRFRTQSAKRCHVSVVHRGEKRFSCHECGMLFGASGDVTRHVQSVHKRLRPFPCELCGARFARMGTLKRHVGTVHKSERASAGQSNSRAKSLSLSMTAMKSHHA